MDTVIVHLRTFKGLQIVKGEDGNVMNQNQTLKLKYDTKEWYNFIETMYRSGWGRVNVLAAKIDKGGETDWAKYKDVDSDLLEKIKVEVQSKLKKTSDKPLTQEQKEIAALKAEMKEMREALSGNKGGDELKALKAEYKELNPTGKGVSPTWSKEEIEEKIAGFKADAKA